MGKCCGLLQDFNSMIFLKVCLTCNIAYGSSQKMYCKQQDVTLAKFTIMRLISTCFVDDHRTSIEECIEISFPMSELHCNKTILGARKNGT